MGLMDGKSAVVTGAGRGIGQQIAYVFAEQGASVVINDLEPGPASETAAECNRIRGGSAVASAGNIADRGYTDQLMKTAVDSFGKLDVLVNNAGVTRDRMVHQMTDEEWDLVIDVNLKGTFNCIRSAAPYMRDTAKKELETEGQPRYHRKVVNFFSTAAIRGNPGQMNYTAAKMGNVGMTRTLAQEWGRFHINVNAVAPGFTDTRLTKPKEDGDGVLGVPKAIRDRMIANIPFGRPVDPREVANVVLFFSCYLSDFVTGQEINVSGGHQIP
ncbi:MAG: 3-oxoacyl-[acyl-carrier-protein] reductase FabG [Myxococcota bacterium]|nr:3-oxoacyl-[acyl-carrier-protein] reductase FabG [Myxococcota bacterium]